MSKLCKCSTCCYLKTAETEFASHHTEVKSADWCSGKRHRYSCGQGQIQEGCGRCIPPPPAIFKHGFGEYSFSIISNLFDNNKPYALSTHIENVRYEQNASYLVKHSKLGAKNFNKICLKIVQKVLKWPLQYVNFEKISGGSMPPHPLEPFLFSMCFKITLHEKKHA